MREIPRPGDRQEVITKDNVVVAVNATIFTQVVDAKQALFSIANFDVAIDALARTALRSVIGTLSLDEALSERERINIDVQQQMEAVTDKWGIRINRIEIVEITPPPQILQALALQKQADQEKRAKILQSEGLQQSAVNVADGDRQAAIKAAEGQRQAAILRAEGERQALILEAEGRAQAIATVYGAIRAGNPDPTLVAILQLDTLAKFAASPNTKIVIPAESSALLGAAQAIQTVLAQVPGPSERSSGWLNRRRAPPPSSAPPLRSARRPLSSGRPRGRVRVGSGVAGPRPCTVARRLGPVATRRHVAPAPRGPFATCRRRRSCSVSFAQMPDALGVAARQLADERVGEARERVVDRIADVAMVDAGRRRAPATSSMTWRAWSARLTVVERATARRALLGDRRRRPRAGRRADGATRARSRAATSGRSAAAAARSRSAPSPWMTPRSTNQARASSSVGRRSSGKPFSGSSVFRKSKVASRLTSWAWPAAADGGAWCSHVDNHITPIDRLRARGYSYE